MSSLLAVVLVVLLLLRLMVVLVDVVVGHLVKNLVLNIELAIIKIVSERDAIAYKGNRRGGTTATNGFLTSSPGRVADVAVVAAADVVFSYW